MDSPDDKNVLNEILNHLKNLDSRISKIENRINVQSIHEDEEVSVPEPEEIIPQKSDDELEFQIGQFWAAKAGILVLLVGFAFLLLLPHSEFPALVPFLFGIVLSLILFGLARFWKDSFAHISGYLVGAGFILSFLTIMRLYFFGFSKAIESLPVEITLLIIVTALSLIVGVRRNSSFIAGLGITFGYVTAVLTDYSYIIFIMILALSFVTVYFKLKYEWNIFLFYGIFLSYLTHFVWFINNPFMGHTLQSVAKPEINLLFILLYVIIFSTTNLLDKNGKEEDFLKTGLTMLNCGGGYGLILLITLLTTPTTLAIYNLIASIVFLSIAITYWIKEKSKYITFFYAMFGYAALSVAINIQFESPDSFVWLCWQSLLVVSTAVWFRSKYIIVANFVIFLMIFAAFLISSGVTSGISLSFGIVALLSARILNWKKDELELKTEQMRNAYLLSALFIIPYSFYQMLPSGYVSLSWIGVAIIYYILSIILKNKKYRWMALATYFLTVLYVFILGITSAGIAYKIISFIVLGATLIIVSIVYSRKKGKDKSATKEA